jgi:hypothetical protein
MSRNSAVEFAATGMERQTLALVGVGAFGLLWLMRDEPSPQVTSDTVSAEQGDLSDNGGSPTVRLPYAREQDDPATSNDESNDQPHGHFGTQTLSVCNLQSGNCYPLDADVNDTALERLYFPKGGWIDFAECELDSDLSGECLDEEGRGWQIDGPG